MLELQRFPTRSVSMCIPVRDDIYEDSIISHSGPIFTPAPTQYTSVAIPSGNRDMLDKLPRPKVKSKPHVVTPEEVGISNWPYDQHVPKNKHLMMYSEPLGLCDNPDCVDCPRACKNKRHFQRSLAPFDNKVIFSVMNTTDLPPPFKHISFWEKHKHIDSCGGLDWSSILRGLQNYLVALL